MPWLARIREARTRDDVVAAARDFVAQLTRAEIERLPPECRPGPIATEFELQEYALQLARHHAHGDAARVIMKLSGVLSSAVARLAELAKRAPPVEGTE